MICKPCARAADLAVQTRAVTDNAVQAVIRRNVDTLHASCRGGTWCDCQHRGRS